MPLLQDVDPRSRPFEISGRDQALLLIHGFTGTPAEMRPIGERIARSFGWKVVAPLLPGHGTTPDDLSLYQWSDWLESARTVHHELLRSFEQVHLVGLSMGTLLCLELFKENPSRVRSMALLAPALFFRGALEKFVTYVSRCSWVSLMNSTLPKGPPLHPDHVTYRRYSIRALGELSKLMERSRELAERESPPTFIGYSETDEVIDPKSASFLLKRLQNPQSRVVRLENSIHVLTLGQEKERLLREMEVFYRECVPKRS